MSLPEEVASLLDAPAAGLARAMTTGHPLESGDLAGHAYLGISLGLPAWVDRALWKTFVKAFAPAQDGGSRGWNVKMAQVGLDGPHAPLLARDGRPRSFGHFRVGPCPAGRVDGLGPASRSLPGHPRPSGLAQARLRRGPARAHLHLHPGRLAGHTELLCSGAGWKALAPH